MYILFFDCSLFLPKKMYIRSGPEKQNKECALDQFVDTGFLAGICDLKLPTTLNTPQLNIIEPRHEKMCLRESPTRPDTNRPAQPQKLARVLKFRL